MHTTTPLAIPDEARKLWELSDAQKAWIPEIRAGRLELKGNTPNRSWRSDEECAVTDSSSTRTAAVAAVLDANGIAASFGGRGYLYAPHVQTFRCRLVDLAGPGPHALTFETLGAVLPDSLDAAAPVVLDLARAAVTACCQTTRPRAAFPGDRSTRTTATDAACHECRNWPALSAV